jgi:sensor histidine kinase YesM
LAFALRYVGLLRIRFGDAVRLRPADDLDPEGLLVPPVSLQVLLENAVKHNRLDESTPLEITIGLEGDGILVKNPRKRPRAAGPSSKVGLGNLDERCRRITGRGVVVRADAEQFAVRVPVVSRAERG